ncbi:MAG: UDP-N-acetylmuramoyl-tripeptide--D-alanyl-D-alanine ligase [Gammaproteobacteria bacterium]
MIRMLLSEAARELTATHTGQDRWFEGVSTDSRTIKSDELYCALRGPTFNGHDYCRDAQRNGAVGVLAEQAIDANLATLTVANSKLALGQLASAWRRNFNIPLVGVTGSNGKTTVKEMITSILQVDHTVLATKGNLNNEIGVPQTLFRLSETHDYAVVEMGASHVGEIESLSALTRPQVAVVTLCAPAHLEGFGSIEQVAEAKGEIYSGLGATGIAVINADDNFAQYWQDVAGERAVVRFGVANPADVMARNISIGGIAKGVRFALVLPDAQRDIDLPFDGMHNVSNAIAAAAVACALNISADSIKVGLETASKVAGRLCVLDGKQGERIIDDTYNANPTSLAAAVELLAAERGERWLVLADMGELGPDTAQLHRDAGTLVRAAGIDRLYTFGDLAAEAGASFGRAAKHYDEIDGLIDDLISVSNHDATILIKGSRAMRMERVVHALAGADSSC